MRRHRGYLEVRRHRWEGWVRLDSLLREDDGEASATLFLAGSKLGFLPPFAARGIPNDVSEECAAEWTQWSAARNAAPTWATLAELREANWDELSANVANEPLSRFTATPGSSAGMTFWRFDGYVEGEEERARPGLSNWTDDQHAYLRSRKTRREVVTDAQDWRALLAVMEALTIEHTADNLRIVIWFS